MQELDDNALLREYVDHDSEQAFATLVTRHFNKVYSVALRYTRDPHQAEEIAQAVFVILAKRCRNLGKRVVLSGWLYETSRLTAVTFIRSEIRRARREQEAHMQTLLNETESDVWSQIAPLLDAAMAGLSEVDRYAVVLRFFDGKSTKEVGIALGASEDAAKMRLNRATEKLRGFFAKRGVVVPAAVLTAAISANSVQAAPAVLAKTATAVALAKGATASSSTLTLITGALEVMVWTKMKTAGVSATLLVGIVTTTLVIHHGILRRDDPTLPSQPATLPRQAPPQPPPQDLAAANEPMPSNKPTPPVTKTPMPPVNPPPVTAAAAVSAKVVTDLQTELKTVVTNMTKLAVSGDYSTMVLMYMPPEELAQIPGEERPAFLQQMQRLMQSPQGQQKLQSQIETLQSILWENAVVNETGTEATFALPEGSPYGSAIFFKKINGRWYIK
jgi:RNA polymerase sigma factor (sigma-70 family)